MLTNIYLYFCDFSSVISLIFLLFKGGLLNINIVDMPKFRNNKVWTASLIIA